MLKMFKDFGVLIHIFSISQTQSQRVKFHICVSDFESIRSRHASLAELYFRIISLSVNVFANCQGYLDFTYAVYFLW